MFLALVVRGYRDTDEYYFSKALRDDIVHEHFDKVSLPFYQICVDDQTILLCRRRKSDWENLSKDIF